MFAERSFIRVKKKRLLYVKFRLCNISSVTSMCKYATLLFL